MTLEPRVPPRCYWHWLQSAFPWHPTGLLRLEAFPLPSIQSILPRAAEQIEVLEKGIATKCLTGGSDMSPGRKVCFLVSISSCLGYVTCWKDQLKRGKESKMGEGNVLKT